MSDDAHQAVIDAVILAVRLEFNGDTEAVARMLAVLSQESLALVAATAIGAFAGMMRGYAAERNLPKDAVLQHFALVMQP